MVDDFRAGVCELIRHNLERKLIPDRIARADFAWAHPNIYALLQEIWAEFAWSEREAMTAIAAKFGRVATMLRKSISAVELNAPRHHLRELNAGASCARQSGGVGAMPSRGENINDWHQRKGPRAASVQLREATRH